MDATKSATYAYDAVGRLQSAATAQWGMQWTYDQYGNRLTQQVTAGSGPSNSVSVDPTTNRLNTAGYGYDAAGNLTNDALNALTYDAENRVVTNVQNGATSTYTYDGNSLRVKKVAGGTTTVYIFSGSKVIAEYDNGAAVSSPTRENIYAGGQLLATIAGGAATYVQADHLSARLVTDANGNVVGQQGHYPFGESWYGTGTTNSKWKFTTYERDAESSNDYAMMRYDVNRLGRFASPDPAGMAVANPANPQSWNSYAYVLNSPISYTDTLGLGVGVCGYELHGWPDEGGLTWFEPIFCFTRNSPQPQTSNTEGGGGNGQHRQCTLNIHINNSAGISNALLSGIEGRIAATFGNTSSPVAVNFSFTGTPDATLSIFSNASWIINELGGSPFGAYQFYLSPRIYVNNFLPSNIATAANEGSVGAHELIHQFLGVTDAANPYSPNSPNLMQFDNAPTSVRTDALLNPNSPLWQLSADQAATLLKKCLNLHP